jgi:hypothetical protein
MVGTVMPCGGSSWMTTMWRNTEKSGLFERKDITDNIPIYKSYWAQSKSLVMTDGVLGRHWRRSTFERSKVKEVLVVLSYGLS